MSGRLLLRAGLCAVLAWVLLGAGSDDEILREFHKYFRKYRDTATRVEAVLALEGLEDPGVVDALVPLLADPEPEVARAARRVLAGFETAPPTEALLGALEREKKEAVRVGLLLVVAAAPYPGARPAVEEALEDRAWAVRRAAAGALARIAGPEAAPALVPLFWDREVAVRCAALDAAASVGSRAVLEPARELLGDESWQVRAAAIAALARVRDRDSIEPLIARLAVEEGRLRDDLGAALEAITGRAFGTRLEAWQRFWEAWKDRFEIPTDEELARLRQKQAETRARYAPGEASSFVGVETPSRRIVFVIDVSGSMEQLVQERERFEDGGYPSLHRIDIVKTELLRTVRQLEPWVEFNILAFATEVRPWKKRLVKANVLNKSSAESFVQRLEAIGGESKRELANVGLSGAANLEAGKTNTYGALMAALGAGDARADYRVDVDTVFFLSDGRPSHGRYTDPEDILREVREANALRRVVIHTIGIGEFQRGFLERLARENQGVFVDLGK